MKTSLGAVLTLADDRGFQGAISGGDARGLERVREIKDHPNTERFGCRAADAAGFNTS